MNAPLEGNWLPMKEVADKYKISYYKLSRLVAEKTISVQTDILDKRVKLVNEEEVKRIFRIK